MLIVGLTVALLPGRASALPPDRNLIVQEDLSIPAGACPFPVFFHVLKDNEYTIDFFDDQGNKVRTIIQGQIVLEITNLVTGVSIVRNVSGPGTKTYADQMFVGRGSGLYFYKPGDLGPGTPGSMFINHGKVVEFQGEPRQIISQTGIQEDLCATLSASPESAATEVAATEAAAGDESQIPLVRLA